jgi:hypothetical protein
MGETLRIVPVDLDDAVPGGGNQSVAALQADY